VLSLNSHDVGGAPKIIYLKRLVHSCKPDFIIIQETMCSGEKVVEDLHNWLNDCSFYSQDLMGLSTGFLSTWSSCLRDLTNSMFPFDILVHLMDSLLNCSFKLINVYRPYFDWCSFWEGLRGWGFITSPNIILEGDLNFNLYLREVWGGSPH
jgi:hypothetical protein